MAAEPTFGRPHVADDPDPSLDATVPSAVRPGTRSVLEALRAEVAADVTVPPVVLECPGRPGWVAIYNPDVDHPTLEKWRKNSRNKEYVDGVDNLGLLLKMLANQNTGLSLNGVAVEDDDGQPVTFRHPLFIEMLPQEAGTRAVDAVRWWYASDGYVFSAGNAVMEAAGYGAQFAGADPT